MAGNEITRRILVVDDEPELRLLLARRFELEGYAVVTAADGQEALDACLSQGCRFDLILSDARMPRLEGLALFAALRREGCGKIPFVLMSGDPGSIHADDSISPKPAAYLAKPFCFQDAVALLPRFSAS